MLVCIAADAFLYLAVRGMAQRSALKAKNDLLSAQIDRQKEHYAALTAQYANIRRMRHDIAKHLDTMQALLQSGQYQAAAAYSNEVSAQAQVQAHLGICENPIVDAYLFPAHRSWSGRASAFSCACCCRKSPEFQIPTSLSPLRTCWTTPQRRARPVKTGRSS